MYELIFELIIVFLVTLFFVYYKKPKIFYLFLGYFMFLIVLLITFPLKYIEYHFLSSFDYPTLGPVLISLLFIIITEISKYLTLKRFLKVKKHKSAVLFGIGWTSLESINTVSILFYSFIFSFFLIEINPSIFLKDSIFLLPFIFLFLSNIAITTLVILAVIKKKLHFLISAIMYAFLIYLGQIFFIQENEIYFLLILFLSSIFILFKYHLFIKK